jgi:hypothetical protein
MARKRRGTCAELASERMKIPIWRAVETVSGVCGKVAVRFLFGVGLFALEALAGELQGAAVFSDRPENVLGCGKHCRGRSSPAPRRPGG